MLQMQKNEKVIKSKSKVNNIIARYITSTCKMYIVCMHM